MSGKQADLQRRTLAPLDNMAKIRQYFQVIKQLDGMITKGQQTNVKGILRLWDAAGELTLTGPDPIGQHVFRGGEELAKFYTQRGTGIAGHISTQFARVTVANAKSAEHVVVSGIRYVVNSKGEGMQAPFTHNFVLNDRGQIQSLHINVGQPSVSEVADPGSLKIEDMGRLAAMAWMVA